MQYKYIAIDGPIGAGKTTLVKMLSKDLSAEAIFEPAEKNPFLPDFYKDRKLHAFKTQIFFLLNRYQQQLTLKKITTPIVCDYTFAKDRVFANINLNEDEQALYERIYSLLHAEIPKPDLVIYMQATPEVLLERIKKRGIGYEKSITVEYLEELTNAYNDYFFNYIDCPLLVVNASDIDYVKNKTDWENLKKAIVSHNKGIAHYHYVSKT
ncbi:MAG: deoxynucleoside kinase [Deltaproteobacteria bacterium CG11_big_fil_rev_8_21_14_0_20_49_13]|nr:MAG: deoxynucleoside kinase [Deltaproteobacteria bacterium CG11_big_fil_rev_8_21_14_0_20_49_13]